MGLPTPQSPTHDRPRISKARFTELLKSKNSPALPLAGKVYDTLLNWGVEPSFALAQFRVESQYGTAGHAQVSGSWGNMLFDSNLTLMASGKYSPGNGYTYATYDSYEKAIIDYCRYLAWYRDRYQLADIYGATARWLGRVPGSTGHINYCNTIVNDMVIYEFPPGTYYNSGDGMIYAGDSIGKNAEGKLDGTLKLRYPINYGDKLYRGPSTDTYLKTFTGRSGSAWYLGAVNGSNDWGAILIGTSVADPDGTVVYIPGIDPAKVIKV